MRRRNTILSVLLLVVGVATAAGVVGALLKDEPAYFTAGGVPEATDPEAAAGVVTRFGDLKNDIRSKPEWGATFTADELNAFLREHLGTNGGLAAFIPAGLTDPRLAIDGDRIKFAARYGRGFWSTVVSVEAKVWLVKGETNVVALELCGVWAGAVSLGSQSILDRISEAARDSNIVITWYRHDGHPVGLCQFYADQPRPTTQIAQLTAGDGKFTVKGRSLLAGENSGQDVIGGDAD